ncbi:membrane protein, partial [Pectobacterium brasiliense]
PTIVVTLDIIKHRRAHYFPAGKAFSVDTFHFQRVKEAFHAGIVITAAFCAHTASQIMAFQQALIIR